MHSFNSYYYYMRNIYYLICAFALIMGYHGNIKLNIFNELTYASLQILFNFSGAALNTTSAINGSIGIYNM